MVDLVDVSALWVRFGLVEAVRGIDLQIPAGGATALLGRNGAGKSTTMRVLAGVVPPSEGHVEVAGHDIRRETLAAKRATGYCPDVGGLVPRATPWEHLQLAARLRRMQDGWETRATDLLERFDLGAASHRVTAGFSHGMGRRMSVLLAAFHEPSVLLLDEPSRGVDVGAKADIHRLIRRAAGAGAAVLLASSDLDEVLATCDRVLVLHEGRLVAERPSAGLDRRSLLALCYGEAAA